MLLFAYNGEGLRIKKKIGTSVLQFVYGGDKVILELDGSGNQVARNVWGSTLLSRKVGTVTGFYLYNGHADVTSIIDADDNTLVTYYYDAFGNILTDTGTFNNPYKDAGYYYDSETGDYYLESRYYDPVTARFLSEDTYRGQLDDPLSLNLYTYCTNNPLIYIDPDGHKSNPVNNLMKK